MNTAIIALTTAVPCTSDEGAGDLVDIDFEIEASADPDLTGYWSHASDLHRDYPKIAVTQAARGWSESPLDEIFGEGAAIS